MKLEEGGWEGGFRVRWSSIRVVAPALRATVIRTTNNHSGSAAGLLAPGMFKAQVSLFVIALTMSEAEVMVYLVIE